MRYYLQQANAHLKYDKISEAEVGSSVQGKETGDKITLEIVPELEGSAFGAPVDDDGFIISHERIIENGILKNFWGDIRYSHYLGTKPTGSAQNFKVAAGSLSTEEMREKPHLEVTHFSAVDVDNTTGDFGGEIRLGWYFDGTSRTPVTGGSVTGNLKDLTAIKLSKDTQLEEDYFGPHSICVEGFRISGE
jgi:PmbA protein